MRKLFVVVLLLCAFGLFAQFGIPAGTKEIGITADIGDLLADDFVYHVQGYGGYFFMDNLEVLLGASFMGATYEDWDAVFGFEAGAYYHFLFSEAMGVFGGAWFGYSSAGDGFMYVPIDAGIELFISKSFGIRAYNQFTLQLEEGADNTLFEAMRPSFKKANLTQKDVEGDYNEREIRDSFKPDTDEEY